jgi:siroheme synthase-like protein
VSNAPLYPLFLKVAGARCVVVGAGNIGLHKARELVAAGARVTIIAPQITAREGGTGAATATAVSRVPEGAEHVARAFEPGDTRGALVVIAATGVVDVDDAVCADARASGALVNAVDRTEVSSFYSGATVRRGPLVVAVGTSGASPALARKVRERIERVLPHSIGILADVLGEARPRLLARYPTMQERAGMLDAFVTRALARFAPAPPSSSSETAADDDDALRAAIVRAVEELLV